MGNQVSSSPTPSQDYQEGIYRGAVAAAAAANMENHGPPQKLQRPNYNKPIISSNEAVRIYGGISLQEKRLLVASKLVTKSTDFGH
ncbi:hypothetical protein L3X38_002262 [Prunus dulcis]|uniref:Uncharacterized protein n=1 Tax=Prunus dulcis TaxID=3755 RepID=A0AAD4ZKL5_PRUDU|nr:hypothetical protein L3X38_002262 [Prunus dulcis]